MSGTCSQVQGLGHAPQPTMRGLKLGRVGNNKVSLKHEVKMTQNKITLRQ